MKIALYIDDGLEQIVLTPETDTERGIVRKLEDGSRELSVCRGKFYECRGGWVTQGSLVQGGLSHNTENESTMIVLRPKKPSETMKGNDE